MLTVEGLWQGVAVGVLRQALVEGGVEHGDVGQLWKQRHRCLDALQVGRVVQRRQRRGGPDRLDHPVVDARGMGEQLAAMHHPVADAVELAARGVLHHQQQLGEGGAVVGVGNHQAVAVAAALPAQHRIAAAQALGEAVQGKQGVGLVDQGELDRRTAAVDHQYVA